jgi:antitoxin component YwqK of YwqJK toxin-antitoxin module
MKRYLLLFVLLNALGVQAQKDDFDIDAYKHTINYADHKVTFQLQPSASELKVVYPDRSYYWFASNQLKITQGGFSGKLLHGSYRDFYTDASLKEQGQFNMGLKVGQWKQWTKEGNLIAQTTYLAGKPEGRFYKYEEGRLVEEGFYRNGLVNGKLKKYMTKDSTQTSTYKHGVLKPAATKKSWFRKIFTKKSKAKK